MMCFMIYAVTCCHNSVSNHAHCCHCIMHACLQINVKNTFFPSIDGRIIMPRIYRQQMRSYEYNNSALSPLIRENGRVWAATEAKDLEGAFLVIAKTFGSKERKNVCSPDVDAAKLGSHFLHRQVNTTL